MFLGSYVTSFDTKSRRIALPKKIRDYLATSEIILSFGFEKCIFGFSGPDWEKESIKQTEQPLTARSARDTRRFIFSSARSIQFDSQGRLVVPVDLLSYAEVKKPIVIGAGDHFEIWDETIWNNYQKQISGT